MKILLILLAFSISGFAQSFSSAVEILTVYSENGKFYLKSIPWDNISPSTRGETSVYRTGAKEPIYSFEVGFDTADRNKLTISDDGEVIFFFIDWMADETKDGHKSINVYRRGKIIADYTKEQITGCDLRKERCDLILNNYYDVIDEEKSRVGRRKIFKTDISEIDKFLSDFPLFSAEGKIYLIDSKRIVHEFDLKTGELERSAPFAPQYEKLKFIARPNRVETLRHESIMFPEFPKLRSGEDTYQALAKLLGMKVYSIYNKKDEQYKQYAFKISSNLTQNGAIEIEDIEMWGGELPKDKILEFFNSNLFDSSSIPSVFKKWHLRSEYFYFRKSNDSVARKERLEELELQKEALEKRLVAEKINDTYIPKDLGEAFIELDKNLPEVSRNEFKSLSEPKDTIEYHFGLGMWLRNNWGLWGGSRLQTYFHQKGITHPDNMSSVILFYYWHWLQGNKEEWKEWEKNPDQNLF